MTTYDADVGVLGLGALGAATIWRLAQRNVDVLAIEQYAPGHARGSSHGETRLFRSACFEHPSLGRLAHDSMDLWQELEQETGEQLLQLSGGLMLGPRNGDLVAGTLKAARANGTQVDRLDHAEILSRFPQHSGLTREDVGVWDHSAGVLRAEDAIAALVSSAQGAGAQVHPGQRVVGIRTGPQEVIIERDSHDDLRVRRLVIAAGPWTGDLLPFLPLTPLRTIMTWFKPILARVEQFELSHFPVFIRQLPQGRTMWGHGSLGTPRVKIGVANDPRTETPTRPGEVDRTVSPPDVAVASAEVARHLKELCPDPVEANVCMITNTPDGQFLVGEVAPRVFVIGGCNGHAFKHATGIGELVARILVGEPVGTVGDFIDPARFGPHVARSPAP